ncbi:MAG: DNA methyltransferase [Brevibacterium aurantiacum]|uniref:DNA methyltransferase n=1 Tax=Brevibacterium aurantiacum TaxID=273384 RepID=UPI003F9184A8
MESAREKALRIHHLRNKIMMTAPVHDTPVGKMHPYWARKPMNILEEIITSLTEPGQLVVDPFMGSGTTLFAAKRNGRRAVGSDISSLSLYLVRALSDIADNSDEIIAETRKILDEHREITNPLYAYGEHQVVERTRYNVVGTYSNGDFTLSPKEYVLKQYKNGRWTGRTTVTVLRSEDAVGSRAIPEEFSHLIDYPVDFESILLRENSRIAIPAGANLGQYFTLENRISINVLLQLIRESPLSDLHSDALKFILSSGLPLLRLSDRKASSQWPYWRPKTNLTSRNPAVVLNQKLARYREFSAFLNEETENVDDDKRTIHVLNVPAQELTKAETGEPVGLVLTDPPYGDQVPYLEYSELWNGILNLELDQIQWTNELVMTNRVEGRKRKSDYYRELARAFAANASLVDEGFLVWFYQDQDLNSWSSISEAAKESDIYYCGCISLNKQRRSMKTVASPGRTLDGDLILIFSRDPEVAKHCMADEQASGSQGGSEAQYYDSYVSMVDEAFRNGSFQHLARTYGTVSKALRARTS